MCPFLPACLQQERSYSPSQMKFFKAAATTALLAFGSVPGVLASKPDPEDPAVVAAQDADHLRRKVGHYFQMLDENGDGFIGVDEVEAKASGLVKQLLNVRSCGVATRVCLSRREVVFDRLQRSHCGD